MFATFYRKRVIAGFDHWASTYGAEAANMIQGRGYSYEILAQLIGAELELKPGCVALEIGSGPGNLGRHLRRLYQPKLCAVEISSEMARRSAESGAYEITIRGNAEHLPFSDAVFTKAYSAFVYHSVFDQVLAYQELYRVLKPSGRAVVIDLFPNHRGVFERITRGLFHSLLREHGAPARYRPLQDTIRILLDCGFAINRVRPVGARRRYDHFFVAVEKPGGGVRCTRN